MTDTTFHFSKLRHVFPTLCRISSHSHRHYAFGLLCPSPFSIERIFLSFNVSLYKRKMTFHLTFLFFPLFYFLTVKHRVRGCVLACGGEMQNINVYYTQAIYNQLGVFAEIRDYSRKVESKPLSVITVATLYLYHS